MEQDYDNLIQDGGGLGYQYYQDMYFNVENEAGTETTFDIPIDAGLQDCLPRSLLASDGGIENSGWTSGSFLVAPTESEPSMRCFNSISDYRDDFNSNSYTFSNPQNPSGTFFNATNGNPDEFLPGSGGYRLADYSYSSTTGPGQNRLVENRAVLLGAASESSFATSSSSFPPIIPLLSSENPVSAASSSQKRRKAKSKASSSDKSRLSDMVTSFSTNQQPKARRAKKAIPPSELEAYKIARNMRSCSRCKARKIKFTYPRPCEACVKAAGDPNLASAICIQNSFIELRFGGFDLLLMSFTRGFLSSEIKSCYGPRKSIRVGMVFHEGQQVPTELAVPVTVREYSTPDSEDPVLYHSVALDRTIFVNVISERYAIVPESMPKLNQLLNWGDANIADARGQSVQQLLITNLKEFMDQYCKHVSRLPLHDLVSSSNKLLKFVRCWRCPYYDLSNSDDDNPILVSKALRNQIILDLKRGIETEERLILKALHKLLYGAKGPGESNMIPLWACMWSLILTYRDCMAVYKQYATAPRPNKFQPGCSNSEMVVGASKHMYNILTANYAALFRQSSPLYIDWRKKGNIDLIGRSEVLRRSFDDLRTQIIKFYQSTNDLSEDDALLKEWIIDQESRLKPHDLHGI